MPYLFSSEDYPDNIADQISDAIPDVILDEDLLGSVDYLTLVCGGNIMEGGEITTSAYIHIKCIVRGTIKRIG
jgi:S-adenosylmethionine synthetase